MKVTRGFYAYWWLVLVLLWPLGCTTTVGDDTSSSGLTVYPTKGFTGVEDTGARYTLPVSASGTSGMTWSAAEDSICTAMGSDSLGKVAGVMPGGCTVSVTAGTESQIVTVTVASYKAADRSAGAAAYTSLSCSGCHDIASGPDISPSGIGKHSDDEIFKVVMTGLNPEGGCVSIGCQGHSFAAPDGIVAYLRSLPSKGVPVEEEP